MKIIKHGNYSKHRCMSWTHTDNTSIRVCSFWGTIRPLSQYVSSKPYLVVRNLKLPVTKFLFTQGPKCNPPTPALQEDITYREQSSVLTMRLHNIRLFIVHSKIIHGNVSPVCTLFNIQIQFTHTHTHTHARTHARTHTHTHITTAHA